MKYVTVFWSAVVVTFVMIFIMAYVAAHFLHKFW